MERKKEMLRRGEIYYADLYGVIGSEQGGIRPVLIVQNDIGNRYSPTTIILPVTSAWKKSMPTHA
ncbi:MAG: type II toxin-antitoxin system PemK/MazF family toxin, partial [Oscillospiraceae bacterium]|nr:type II toxin-antitoxin system PemK/MazF family toxin [Oscillospiraceae bacterium]